MEGSRKRNGKINTVKINGRKQATEFNGTWWSVGGKAGEGGCEIEDRRIESVRA